MGCPFISFAVITFLQTTFRVASSGTYFAAAKSLNPPFATRSNNTYNRSAFARLLTVDSR